MHNPPQGGVEDRSMVVWRAYFLTEIFPEIMRGKRLKTTDHTSGAMPYVSSSAMNNAVDDFVGNDSGVRIFGNCLTIANSGSVGATFFHPYDFVASDHVTHMKRMGFSPYQYLFVAVMCRKLAGKYNFNREINDTRIEREKIMLPCKSDHTPDFDYMDAYGREIHARLVESYLIYRNSADRRRKTTQ